MERDSITQDHVSKTYWQLNELKSAPGDASNGSQNYNLSQITQSVVDVWRDDFAKAGISVELEDENKSCRIALESFNLTLSSTVSLPTSSSALSEVKPLK